MFLSTSVVPPSIELPRGPTLSYAPRSQQISGELSQLLVGLRPHPLRQRSFRPRLAVFLYRRQAAVGGQPQHLGLEVELAEALGAHRVLEQIAGGGLGDDAVKQLAQPDLEEEGQPGPLVHQRRQRDLPTVADAAEDVLVRDAG